MNEEQHCRSLVNARSGGRCELCGGIGHSLHHRKKRSQGGDWCPSNVVRVCGRLGTVGCHGWCESNPDAAEKIGFHVRPWQDPEEIPVKYLRSEWKRLLPDGGTAEADAPEVGSGDNEEETSVCDDSVRSALPGRESDSEG